MYNTICKKLKLKDSQSRMKIEQQVLKHQIMFKINLD